MKSPFLHAVGVWCSAQNTIDPKYLEIASALGSVLAKNSFGIVDGGANTGAMKALVDSYLANGGVATNAGAVILERWNTKAIRHPKQVVFGVETLEERLKLFDKLCNSIVVLPGGLGTLQELLFFVVRTQIGQSGPRRYIVLNTDGFYDGLQKQLNDMVDEGALTKEHRKLIRLVSTVEEVIEVLTKEKPIKLKDSQYYLKESEKSKATNSSNDDSKEVVRGRSSSF